ncbi:type II toxin-antitoxin system RelE/ParE family toxin [Janthinobacterium sp. RA13]|uniref:type II toxin-antitoxin system RelE/ParE family toxin n=1 Tax=Janthinobacterium sp. RA13 TaxID=1502762 RepID=UPI00055AB94F|nr:type II toxin-antitoxin system RelE/ParE family toxin [Janthinobacterium sp. RA13]
MKTVKKTRNFSNWLSEIKDDRTRAIIAQHIVRLENGLGDVKPVGGGVRELRIDVGPGWRVYFIEVEGYVIVLLVGGNKSRQTADIKKARQMVTELKKSAAVPKK